MSATHLAAAQSSTHMPTADSATHVATAKSTAHTSTAAPMTATTATTAMPSGHGARRQHGSECDGGEADHRLACNGLLHDALLNEVRGDLPAFRHSDIEGLAPPLRAEGPRPPIW